jgi:hypothetical protein
MIEFTDHVPAGGISQPSQTGMPHWFISRDRSHEVVHHMTDMLKLRSRVRLDLALMGKASISG